MKFICCICGCEKDEWGNNPEPVKTEGVCCSSCNEKYVLSARLGALLGTKTKKEV